MFFRLWTRAPRTQISVAIFGSAGRDSVSGRSTLAAEGFSVGSVGIGVNEKLYLSVRYLIKPVAVSASVPLVFIDNFRTYLLYARPITTVFMVWGRSR